MGEFATALKDERKKARKTLQETSDFVGRSVGYISDIEQSRTGPPDIEVVKKFEEFFDTAESRLVHLAVDERTKNPNRIPKNIQGRPYLRDLYFRLQDMSEEDLKTFLEKNFES